ncbi:MAG: RNA polymerase sigma factor [Pseudomonadota bacterium]
MASPTAEALDRTIGPVLVAFRVEYEVGEDGLAAATDEQRQAMDRFLAGVEQRAYAMTVMSIRNADDALDVIQDAMITLASKYGHRPETEWAPLFFRILKNKTTDFVRRRNVKDRLFGFFGVRDDEHSVEGDPIDNLKAAMGDSPEMQHALSGTRADLMAALAMLPDRQRDAFLLREVEGFPVADTAVAMGCSESSVKTHYSRAITNLRETMTELMDDDDAAMKETDG